MNKSQRGFTIIELVVVIAIVAVLSGIVIINVNTYLNKAKITRFEQEAGNFEKASVMFYAKYGAYPGQQDGWQSYCPTGAIDWDLYCGEWGSTGPYLVDGTGTHYLTEFLPISWAGPNAGYYGPNGFYMLQFFDGDGDPAGKLGCGRLWAFSINNDWSGASETMKNILCQDCPDECGYGWSWSW